MIQTTISDHYTVFGCVQNKDKTKNNTKNTAQCVETEQIDNKKVNQLLNEINWGEIINRSKNVDELFHNICNIFEETYTKSKQKQRRIKKTKWLPMVER